MVDKDWSIEEALKADQEARSQGADGPTTPLFQWNALNEIDALGKAYDGGDSGALFAAIRKCANHDLVMPEWVRKAFIRGYDEVLNCRVRTWDEAFGVTGLTGKQLSSHRSNRTLRFPVYARVIELTNGPGRRSIDDGLFEEVGEEFEMRATRAKKLYYQAKKMVSRKT